MDCRYWEMERGKEPEYDPKLRKATPMMRMIISGIKSIFNEETGLNVDPNTQLILTSCHGELAPTYDYLKDSAMKGWTRPFLFQNSLHHSTTGFLSQYFQILGPAYSVCGIEDAQEGALSVGLMNMNSSSAPTLFVHAEYFPEELVDVSDYEAIRICNILYVGNNKVKVSSQFKDIPAGQGDAPDTYFHKIGKSVASKDSVLKLNFSSGRSFELSFDYQ